MKSLVFSLVVTFAMTSFTGSDLHHTKFNPALADGPAFNWNETSFNFGKIKQNVAVSHEFRFVNKGKSPLVIASVQASCGCTVTKYTKDPIMPGGEGFVTATYDAAAKGAFSKTVTVNANTENGAAMLTIKGEVD